VHPMFRRADEVPLALGAREGLLELAHPRSRGRVQRWVRARCGRPEYLVALAAEGARRHDRHGDPVDPAHRERARRTLATRRTP
jgi:hypothetical protein